MNRTNSTIATNTTNTMSTPMTITTKIATTVTELVNTTTNTTNPPIPLAGPPIFPIWFKVGLAVVGVLTLFGNMIVVCLIATRRRLRTKTNYMVASLAVSDLLVGSCIIPSYLACMYEDCDKNLSKLFYDGFLFVSVCNLCCITFDRFLAVTRPLRYHTKITRKAVIYMIVTSWILPSMMSLVPVTWLYSRTNRESQILNSKIFYTIQVVVFVFCPCLIMLIAYAVILNIAWKQTRHIRHEMRRISNASSGPRPASIRNTTTREAKATLQVFGTVVLMFVCCWSISAFRTIVTQYDLIKVPWDVTNASRLLLVANSAVNPIIYALWKKDIKKEIKRVLKLNSRLVRSSSAILRSSQDLRFDSSSFASSFTSVAERRRSQTNSAQEPIAMAQAKKAEQERKENGKPLSNGGFTSVESVEIRTVEERATIKPTDGVSMGIDNLVAQVDGMV